jgi:hypothetical protein
MDFVVSVLLAAGFLLLVVGAVVVLGRWRAVPGSGGSFWAGYEEVVGSFKEQWNVARYGIGAAGQQGTGVGVSTSLGGAVVGREGSVRDARALSQKALREKLLRKHGGKLPPKVEAILAAKERVAAAK